jgi:glucuronate isomerase
MNREEWREQIMQLPVYDSHTHLNMPDVPIPAQNIWDIVHYFWFQEELWSVGYPRNARALSVEDRIPAFVKAFNATRNTVWHHIVCRILSDLYKIDIDALDAVDENLVRKADQAIQWYSWQPNWSQSVIDRLHIRRIGVNSFDHADFKDLPGVSVVIPVWDGARAWTERIKLANDMQATGKASLDAAKDYVEECHNLGIKGLRVGAEVLEGYGSQAVNYDSSTLNADSELWEIEAFIAHAQFKALSDFGMFAQLFMGIKRDVTQHTAMAVNDPLRITAMYPLFERYACGFELVVGAPGNNMDAVQAARIYPNVFLGGLWWYNFRSSTYMQTMQERLEAVPASKSILVASDARCIEWCYGKILLVKTLLADFLFRQIALGWLSEADALWVAKEWLHDAADRRYS